MVAGRSFPFRGKGGAVTTLNVFLHQDEGQDLIEYTLLLAFVALASAALFIGAGNSIAGIWSNANQKVSAANAAIP
jgi:Flp pilus assembly pilin Flp